MDKPKPTKTGDARSESVGRPARDKVRLARNRFGDITGLERRALRSGDGDLLTDEGVYLVTRGRKGGVGSAPPFVPGQPPSTPAGVFDETFDETFA